MLKNNNRFYSNFINKYNGLLKVIYNSFCKNSKVIEEYEKVATAFVYIRGLKNKGVKNG